MGGGVIPCHSERSEESTKSQYNDNVLLNYLALPQNDKAAQNRNFLIKGNNLLALHSLKHRKDIYGQVKLIYIDPPYNTGNDSFNYNDNFNHSTWLTFMKNRLEIAREFLREDGVIFVQCDDNEQAYLKVLMDEIFGRGNFVNTICWQKKNSPQNDAKWLSDNHDFILIYAKSKETWRPNLLPRTKEMNARYKNLDNDPRGDWMAGDLSVKTYSANYDYPITTPSGKIVYPPSGSCWQTSKENFEKMLQDNRIYFGKNNDAKPQIKQFLSEVQQGVVSKTFWKYDEAGHNQIAKQEIKALFANDENTDLFSTPKPEALLKRIIEISTQEGDLIMDFFAGSGTTLAVAHKMKRRWIGIEQMDYVENITKERLKKVIAGEQGGVSKALNFTGGGAFAYLELMPLNAVYKEKIVKLQDEKELENIYKDLREKAFVDYRVDIQAMLKDKDFHALSVEEKKAILYSILDSNMDYVLYDDIEDSEYKIDKDLIALNKAFYGVNDE